MNSIERFVTNQTERVFLFRNLPEEVIATTMAQYSRSPNGLRENLLTMIERGDIVVRDGVAQLEDAAARERSQEFQRKWIVGYGHTSVAEHAVVHFGMERISRIAAKEVERHRLASYTERSTRYLRQKRENLVEDVGFEGPERRLYLRVADDLFAAYDGMFDELSARLEREHKDIDARSRNARACDMLRGILPAGLGSSVGVTAGARTLAHMIRTLAESRLPECNGLSDELRREATTELPVLVRHLRPSSHRSGAEGRVWEVLRRIYASPGALLDDEATPPWHAGDETARGHEVEVLEHHKLDARSVATAILREVRDAGSMRPGGRRKLTEAHAREVIDAYMADRGQWDAVCRALEHSQVTFRIDCDYGAWCDLQRHRMGSQTEPLLTPHLGFACPDALAHYGMEGRFHDAMHVAAKAYERIVEGAGPNLAQYAVPLGCRVSWVDTVNLRSLFQKVELRSGSAGHPSYRAVAIDLGDETISLAPWVSAHLRVDREGYVWAREPKPMREPAPAV